ncbi:response regulator [Streptomyces sp. bgisy095]|uniref:response regulator n=1 Tax=unclassified Streptomyces TaxID=2593676 RepID=UPI003D720AEC
MNRYFRGVTKGRVPRTGQKWVKAGRGRRGRPTLVRVSGASGRVLVVDDNKVIRQLIRVNLELEGFEVVTAADGAECLDVVHRVRPDVVTLDVVMPRLDGIRTAERLRADPRTRHLPVAIISACGEAAGEAASGVDAFLSKPFEPTELVRVVRQLMHRERRERPDVAGRDGGEEPAAVRGLRPAVADMPRDGLGEGLTDGPRDGLRDNGLGEGAPDGLRDGLREGARDGLREGPRDGLREGSRDGLLGGAVDGRNDPLAD